jgi:hypothetical protein
MQLKRILVIALTLFFLVAVEDAEAQRRSKYQKRRSKNKAISRYRGGSGWGRFTRYSYVGFNVNAMNYFGDLAPVNKAASTDISFTRPGFGVEYGYQFHHSMALRAAFNYGRLVGDDFSADPGDSEAVNRYARNLSFRNDIKELSVGLMIYLLPNYGGPQSRPILNGYLFVGGAVFHSEPRGKVPDADYQSDPNGGVALPQGVSGGEWVKLRELQTEGQEYGPFQIAIPVSIGGELYLNNRMSIGMEFGIRKLFFDYLDDVSSEYQDLDSFDDPLARIMSDRSLEPKSGFTDENRTLPYPAVLTTYESGESYWRTGALGSGLDGSIRGNPDDNDLYVVTQLKFKYILNPSRRGRAKYR